VTEAAETEPSLDGSSHLPRYHNRRNRRRRNRPKGRRLPTRRYLSHRHQWAQCQWAQDRGNQMLRLWWEQRWQQVGELLWARRIFCV